MKKFFFFLFLFFPIFVQAGSIKDFTGLNGKLSREFETDNNLYSVILNEGEDTFLFDFELEDKEASVFIEGTHYDEENKENKTKIMIENQDGTKEEYTFYLERENVETVFQDVFLNDPIAKEEIPFLKFYVICGCSVIILLLFKIIVLGFNKKHKLKYGKVNCPSRFKSRWFKRK